MHVKSEYIILFLGWAAWCSVHSLLISAFVTEALKTRLGSAFKFYRLAYNLFAILTVIPLAIYTTDLAGSPVFMWEGWFRLPQCVLIALGLFYFIVGGRSYDYQQLLGIRQIRTNTAHSTLEESGKISTKGILGVVRHPWYAGTLMLIWARTLDTVAVTLNIVFTIYLIVGTLLEERKLCREFGESYQDYQRQVSMFFPWKYMRKKLHLDSVLGG